VGDADQRRTGEERMARDALDATRFRDRLPEERHRHPGIRREPGDDERHSEHDDRQQQPPQHRDRAGIDPGRTCEAMGGVIGDQRPEGQRCSRRKHAEKAARAEPSDQTVANGTGREPDVRTGKEHPEQPHDECGFHGRASCGRLGQRRLCVGATSGRTLRNVSPSTAFPCVNAPMAVSTAVKNSFNAMSRPVMNAAASRVGASPPRPPCSSARSVSAAAASACGDSSESAAPSPPA
jgi:hypothetical protein